jgi:S1-C subfamily serine protease
VVVDWLRSGEPQSATVTLTTAPDDPPRARQVMPEGSALQGLTVETINPAVIAERNLPLAARGVVVAAAQGWAARIGLQSGDILLAVNGVPVADSAGLAQLAAPRAGVWQIDILRDGRQAALRFRL